MKLLRPTHPYIPMACGFLYLVAIIDWASRAVLAWRLSNTNDARFCAAALEEALLRFKPRIHTDSQRSPPVSGRPVSNTDRPTGRLAP